MHLTPQYVLCVPLFVLLSAQSVYTLGHSHSLCIILSFFFIIFFVKYTLYVPLFVLLSAHFVYDKTVYRVYSHSLYNLLHNLVTIKDCGGAHHAPLILENLFAYYRMCSLTVFSRTVAERIMLLSY